MPKNLMSVKTRKQSYATVITLPHKLHIPANRSYYLYEDKSGNISLIPKAKDIFKSMSKNDYRAMDKLATSYKPKGNEWK